MKQSLSLFRNIKFNISLFALLAAFSIAGTLVPQSPESPEKVEEFIAHSPKLGAIFSKIDFFDIYHSWWFVGLLGLLAFDVVVCKLIFGKFPGFRTFKEPELKPIAFTAQALHANWNSRYSVDDCSKKITGRLQQEGYSIKIIENISNEKSMIVASKHRIQRFGSWVSHVSILVILLANLAGALYGFREVINLPEGLTSKMQNRPWAVTCDKFLVDWYPGTETPKTFASNLRLFDKGQIANTSQILVNEPMEYKKVRFYQASYGPYLKEARIGFFLRKTPKESPTVVVRLDEDVPVPGTPYSLRILQFIPDFSLDQNKQAVTRSVRAENPALQILVSKNGKPMKAPWVFEKFPTLQMPPIQDDDDFILVLAEYVPAYYTGLQITYDPGADLFWMACALLVAGLMVLFYFHHRKLWILIEKTPLGNGTAIQTGGFSSRGKSFEDEFARLTGAFRAESS